MKTKIIIGLIGIVALFALVRTYPASKLGSYTGPTFFGNVLQLNPFLVNVFLGVLNAGNLNQGVNGWVVTATSSIALTPSQFCGSGAAGASNSYLITGTTANATVTLPSIVASGTWQACGSPPAGANSVQYLVNDSATNTVTQVAGSGMTLRYASNTPTTLFPLSTWELIGFWDTTGSLYINVEQYH